MQKVINKSNIVYGRFKTIQQLSWFVGHPVAA